MHDIITDIDQSWPIDINKRNYKNNHIICVQSSPFDLIYVTSLSKSYICEIWKCSQINFSF